MEGSETFHFKKKSYPKDREMNSRERGIVFLAGKANLVYQLPEQVITEKTEEKFGC